MTNRRQNHSIGAASRSNAGLVARATAVPAQATDGKRQADIVRDLELYWGDYRTEAL